MGPDDDQERVLQAVLAALATVDGVDPAELDYALYDWLDPDALAALYTESPGFASVTFTVETHEVIVAGDGTITVDGTTSGIDELCDHGRGDGE